MKSLERAHRNVHSKYRSSDRSYKIASVHMRENSFATITSVVEGHLFSTRVPLILDPALGPRGTLLGHVARSNPQWRSFSGENEVLAAFEGPHAYISPNWYVSTPAVPTWNYAAVHAYRLTCIIEDAPRLGGIVDQLTSTYESDLPDPWPGPGHCLKISKPSCSSPLSVLRYRLTASRGNSNLDTIVQ